ncbi:MAG TPA: hypothetical protein VKE74_27465, partial [Gemmataceae bacterium]|nr:hypothetical protein [Gemmataceae bacterium]
MTEEEWFTSRNLRPLIQSLDPQNYDRKLRLFAVACCRRIWDLITDPIGRELVELSEQHADGLVDAPALHAAAERVGIKVAAGLGARGANLASWRASTREYLRSALNAVSAVICTMSDWNLTEQWKVEQRR